MDARARPRHRAFADSKPHILEDVDTVLEPGMALIVHPNTYHPEVGYIVLGDAVVVTEHGAEVLVQDAARTCSKSLTRGVKDNAPRPDRTLARSELPDAVLDARLDRVRAAMHKAQLDALIIYTNNTRPAGVSWLTGFVPYWSEALLVVPRDGAAVSRRGADLSRQNLDRAHQPHWRGHPYATHRA